MSDEKDLKNQGGDAGNEGNEKMKKGGLLDKALKAFGIAPEFVFSFKEYPEKNEVVIVTNGGKKVRWAPGMEVAPLDAIAVTGINPIKRKPITGPGAGKKK